jgi:biopolymer transport protein ExbD
MNARKPHIWIIGIFFLLSACNSPKLDGHYHLIWDKNGRQFQTWNISNNRMKINEEVCSNPDSCSSSVISFQRNTITINPWVDIEYTANYKIDEEGVVTMYGDNDTLWLVPQYDCLASTKYFENKTKQLTDSFNLLPETMTGVAEFPANYENELIIGGNPNSPFFIFNTRELKKTTNEGFDIAETKNQSVWIHVDKHILVQEALPIVKELFEKGYLIHYSTIQLMENNEQIKLMDRTIRDFNLSEKQIEIDYCEFCSKHSDSKHDSIVKIEMLGADQYVMNGDTNDLFHTRNSLVRYIIQNRTTRLNTQIQLEIDGTTPFSDYLTLLDELRWVHVETSDITYYKGKDDPDADWIRKKQENFKSQEILDEFPMRIKEIIKITAPNKTYKQ